LISIAYQKLKLNAEAFKAMRTKDTGASFSYNSSLPPETLRAEVLLDALRGLRLNR
jgi:hypothetical protein